MTDSDIVKLLKAKLWINPQHVVATATLLVAFLVMASIFAPAELTAVPAGGPYQGPYQQHSQQYSSEFRENMSLLGEIESNDYRVKFFASAKGPLYTVYDKNGVELAELLTPRQIADQFPSLPLTDAQAEVPLKMMGTDVGGRW